MLFHLTMMLLVIVVSMVMHAMAVAASPGLAGSPAQSERYDVAVRQAGEALNEQLTDCREQAKREPKASRRELKACERTARAEFRKHVRQARAQ